VVDDDQLLRETVSWMLEGEGYAIVGLPSAEDALVQLQRERFDVLLADIRLPGMDGETFVDRVEREWPDLARRAVLTSGLLHLPRRPNLYLQKPFDRAQLLDTLMAARAQR
jgi:two-component system response regulator GlrR